MEVFSVRSIITDSPRTYCTLKMVVQTCKVKHIFKFVFPFKHIVNMTSENTQCQWQIKKNITDLYSVLMDPAKDKVKRAFYINYQNRYVTKTKACMCLTFNWWQLWKDTWIKSRYVIYYWSMRPKGKNITTAREFSVCARFKRKTVPTWRLEVSQISPVPFKIYWEEHLAQLKTIAIWNILIQKALILKYAADAKISHNEHHTLSL